MLDMTCQSQMSSIVKSK